MRIIAGEYKGRVLSAPKGSATRPTTDRVRESLMSALFSLRGGFDNAAVLDAFAGTGALGIEALSRGASFCCFCERDAQAFEVLKKNLSFVDSSKVRSVQADVLKRNPPVPPKPYGLLFFDPPYALEARQVLDLIGRLTDSGVVADDAIVTYEHDCSVDVASLSAWGTLGFELSNTRSFGDTAIDIFRKA